MLGSVGKHRILREIPGEREKTRYFILLPKNTQNLLYYKNSTDLQNTATLHEKERKLISHNVYLTYNCQPKIITLNTFQSRQTYFSFNITNILEIVTE